MDNWWGSTVTNLTTAAIFLKAKLAEHPTPDFRAVIWIFLAFADGASCGLIILVSVRTVHAAHDIITWSFVAHAGITAIGVLFESVRAEEGAHNRWACWGNDLGRHAGMAATVAAALLLSSTIVVVRTSLRADTGRTLWKFTNWTLARVIRFVALADFAVIVITLVAKWTEHSASQPWAGLCFRSDTDMSTSIRATFHGI